MLALIAAIIWFLGAFHIGLGSTDMLLLGLGFLGLHLALGIGLPVPPTWHRQP